MSIADISFPFSIDSEEEVRISLAFYFKDLGFSLEDMSFEDSFQVKLGHATFGIEKDMKRATMGGRSDMLLMHMGKPLAIVETKAFEKKLTDEDRDQGLSYARLIRQMPPYTIVTNGRIMQVFDTLTTEEIASGTPEDSAWWKNNQEFVGSDPKGKNWACKTLLNLNYELFRDFCFKQMERGMGDLKGTTEERRRYAPELYVPRQIVQDKWKKFLESEYLCFGILGESGTGKTNELCFLSDSIVAQDELLGLFYRGIELRDGIAAAIKGDFMWEFEREEPISRIVNRISELTYIHRTKLIIFIDGLDEFPGKLENLRAELVGLVANLDPDRIRLCLSCKTHDWDKFVFERGETINRLGKFTYPFREAFKRIPGIELGLFTERELDEAWEAYRSNYLIDGQLQGDTRAICRMPLILRVVSETYGGLDRAVPSTLSNMETFDNLWKQKLEEFDPQSQLIMEKIVTQAAEALTWSDQSVLDEEIFFQGLEAQFATHPAYSNVFRFGLIVRRDSGGKKTIAFPFDRLRSYAYTRGRHWKEHISGEKISQEVRRILNTRLGRDTLLFYLQTSNRVNEWIAPLIEENPALFVKAIHRVESRVDKEKISEAEESHESFISSLVRTIFSYSRFRSLFPNLKSRLTPYSDGEAGLLVIDSWHCYRTLTRDYPQAVVLLKDVTGPLTDKQRQELCPVDRELSNTLWHDIQRKLPESIALTEFTSQLAGLVSSHFLDESTCPEILSERILYILKHEPSMGVEGSPKGLFWQQLGFTSWDLARDASCQDLLDRVRSLIDDWFDTVKTNVAPRRWFQIYLIRLMALAWNLEQLQRYSDTVLQVQLNPREIFSYLEGEGLEKTSKIAVLLIPRVIDSYRKLVERNFPRFLSEFNTYQASQGRLLLELSEDSSLGIKSDFLHLSYIWLPSLPPGPPTIRIVPLEESLAENVIIGHSSIGNIYSKNVELTTIIDGVTVKENNAVISRVKYPDSNPIIDQVYQLIANEAEEVFGSLRERSRVKYTSGHLEYYDKFSRYVLSTWESTKDYFPPSETTIIKLRSD